MTTLERPEQVTEEQFITITPAALGKIRDLLVQREIPDHALRVFVTGGGCSGLSYGMAFENNFQEFDTLIEVQGVKLVVDATSILYIKGSTIDFVDSLMGGGFSIDNPQAVSTCGCGHSFRTTGSDEASEGGCSTCN